MEGSGGCRQEGLRAIGKVYLTLGGTASTARRLALCLSLTVLVAAGPGPGHGRASPRERLHAHGSQPGGRGQQPADAGLRHGRRRAAARGCAHLADQGPRHHRGGRSGRRQLPPARPQQMVISYGRGLAFAQVRFAELFAGTSVVYSEEKIRILSRSMLKGQQWFIDSGRPPRAGVPRMVRQARATGSASSPAIAPLGPPSPLASSTRPGW